MIVQASFHVYPHTCIAVNISNVIFFLNSLEYINCFHALKIWDVVQDSSLNQYFQTGGEKFHLTVFGHRTRSGAASYSYMYLVRLWVCVGFRQIIKIF